MLVRVAVTVALAAAAAGCAAPAVLGEQPKPAAAALQPPLGQASLNPQVQGVKLLVVGDSWARNLGVGAAAADPEHRNVVINAAEAGCGLMQPLEVSMHGKLMPAAPKCNSWPDDWQRMVAQYQPTAVLLNVGYWDGQARQVWEGARQASTIVKPAFRTRFSMQLARAISILSGGGAPVFLPTVIDNPAATRAQSDAMNAEIRAAAQRSPQVRLLELHDQLCVADQVCPAEIDGIKVYDETGHPAPAARDRLGAWILNTVHADRQRQGA